MKAYSAMEPQLIVPVENTMVRGCESLDIFVRCLEKIYPRYLVQDR